MFDARARFDQTRQDVMELDEVLTLIVFHGENWRPESVSSGMGNPTESKALALIGFEERSLPYLERRRDELTEHIGRTLKVIQAVHDGFGEIYAILLEHRYIDVWPWSRIHEEYGISRQHGHYLIGVAFDWIDSVGVSKLLKGEYEL